MSNNILYTTCQLLVAVLVAGGLDLSAEVIDISRGRSCGRIDDVEQLSVFGIAGKVNGVPGICGGVKYPGNLVIKPEEKNNWQ